MNIDPSAGEELIGEYFKEKSIKFERESKISKLDGDYADYRVADFYLPKYKVYVEFFGKWNVPKDREKYRKKKEIYEKNRIPCVYLYPDNLGILDFIFNRRLREVLSKYPNLKLQKFLYNLNIIFDRYGLWLIALIIGIYYTKDVKIRIILSILLIYSLYLVMKSTFFKK
ncbi:hypothetical protein J4480_03590 [Candidatus Woesearchaeota archaeon]|nr:hypothetical protein [Candidatus Woesearchaeota archaeon]